MKLRNSLRAVDSVYDSTWKISTQTIKNRENYFLGKGEVIEQLEPCLDHLKVCVPPWLFVQINNWLSARSIKMQVSKSPKEVKVEEKGSVLAYNSMWELVFSSV